MKNLIRILLVAVTGLIILGLIMVFTSSNMYSQANSNSLYSMFNSHTLKVILAVILMFVFAFFDYTLLKDFSKYFLIGVLIMLVITLFMPEVKGASRWIRIGPIGFQPSELAKLALIIHLAGLIEDKGNNIKSFKKGFLFPLVWVFAVCGLVVLQPNMSTAMIIMFLCFTIMYVGGAKFKHIVGTVGITGFFGASILMMMRHSRERIVTFVQGLMNGGDANIQVTQAKIALGSGGATGIGIGQSRQGDLFIPEAFGDFIFSILGEELGFVGTVGILLVYLTVFAIGLIIAVKAVDRFGSLLAFGLSFNIIISAFINAGVVTGLMPTTGITLPFISFGGTSIILFGISVGILMNIGNTYMKQNHTPAEEPA